jgi:glucose uptake protein GlcU
MLIVIVVGLAALMLLIIGSIFYGGKQTNDSNQNGNQTINSNAR